MSIIVSGSWKFAGTGAIPDLSITLDFGGGSTATFALINGVDTGDFIGTYVRQKSYLDTNPTIVGTPPDMTNWRVWFRVDAYQANGLRIIAPAVGWRDEIIVEYGSATHGTPINILSAYTATVNNNGGQVYQTTVPVHFWYSRWRYQSAVRPIVRTPAAIKALGWIPNYGTAGAFGRTGQTTISTTWGGPMSAPPHTSVSGNGNFATAWGATGDDDQLGYLTWFAADYVVFGTSQSLTCVRTEGEWCGNFRLHIRNDDGSMLNVTGLGLGTKSDGGTINNSDSINGAGNAAFVTTDPAHWRPVINLPWLMFEDPFFLEELQHGVNSRILGNYSERLQFSLAGIIYAGQTRSFAWSIRDVSLLAASTPATVPSWLLPASYWKAALDDHKNFAYRYINSPSLLASGVVGGNPPSGTGLRDWTRTDWQPAWQSSWLNAVTGICVDQGFADWAPVHAWGVDQHIQQSNGTSGWNKQWPAPYYAIPDTNPSHYGTARLYVSDTSQDANTAANWGAYWNYYYSGSDGHSDDTGATTLAAFFAANPQSGWDGHSLMGRTYYTAPSYLLHLRSVLAVAVKRAVPGAQACYNYIHGELATWIGAGNSQMPWAIDPPIWPAWRTAMTTQSVFQSIDVASGGNSSVAGISGATYTHSVCIINDWSGWAYDDLNDIASTVCNGGHDDSDQNGVESIAINVAQPGWIQARAMSDTANVGKGTSSIRGTSPPTANYHFTTTGEPGSRHSYYNPKFINARGRVFLLGVGAIWDSGGDGNYVVSYNPALSDFDRIGGTAQGVYPDRPSTSNARPANSKHPTTEDVYCNTDTGVMYRWQQSDANWYPVSLAASANTFALTDKPSVIDVANGRFRFMGVAGQKIYGIDLSQTPSPLSINTSIAGGMGSVTITNGSGMVYDPDNDRYIFLAGGYTGADFVTNTSWFVYAVDATTLTCTQINITAGNPTGAISCINNGIYNRLSYSPKLGGIVLCPSHGSSLYFMPTRSNP